MEDSPFLLTAPEIEAITGLKQAAAQLRWLRLHGWRAHASARGEVVVDRRHYESRMIGRRQQQDVPPKVEPNFDVLREI